MYRHLGRIGKLLVVALHFTWKATLLILWTMALSTTSLIHGIPKITAEAAHIWKKELVDMGLPDIYMNVYFHAARIMAVLFVFIGWVCFSFTTVYLVMLVVQ
jgi:hypothetical protein